MVHSISGWTRGVQVKLWDPLRTRAIPERLRGVFTTRRYTNSRLPLPLPLPRRSTRSTPTERTSPPATVTVWSTRSRQRSHSLSQGVHWVHMHPQSGEKMGEGGKFTGGSCKCIPRQRVHPRCIAWVQFFLNGRFGRWEVIWAILACVLRATTKEKCTPDKILATPMSEVDVTYRCYILRADVCSCSPSQSSQVDRSPHVRFCGHPVVSAGIVAEDDISSQNRTNLATLPRWSLGHITLTPSRGHANDYLAAGGLSDCCGSKSLNELVESPRISTRGRLTVRATLANVRQRRKTSCTKPL